MFDRIAASVALAAGICSAGYLVGEGLKFLKRFDRAVEVKGLAERTVRSTDAVWHLDYILTGDDLAAINAEASHSQTALRAFLVGKGFEDAEIQKNGVQIHDRSSEQDTNKKAPHYSARGSFIVGSKKIDAVTQAAQQTDELLKAGVLLESSGISYYFSDLNAIKPEMLVEATANAREAAQSFATNAHSHLGTIKSASQGQFSIGAPFSEYDSAASLMKKVRVVTQVSYFLE